MIAAREVAVRQTSHTRTEEKNTWWGVDEVQGAVVCVVIR